MWRAAIGLVWALSGCTGFLSNPLRILLPKPDTTWTLLDLEQLGPDGFHDADFEELFPEVPLGLSAPPCAWIRGWAQGPPGAPVFMLVHGIDGVGREWERILPELLRRSPAAVFMYQWSPYEKRDVLVSNLAVGISRVATCLQGSARPIVVFAHSAGGVLASYAASRVVTSGPSPPSVTLVTVSAPLAGFGTREGRVDGLSEYTFLLDIGSVILGYPAATPGVRVVHFRTVYPGDATMRRRFAGHAPNRRGSGVPGALEISLPDTWGHVSSAVKIAHAIGVGQWLPWENFADAELFADRAPPPEEPAPICQVRGDILLAGDPFSYVSFDDPPDPVRHEFWEGTTLRRDAPSPDAFVRCRPCDCVGGRIEPWADWERLNRVAYEFLRAERAPYPVVIVPGFYDQDIMLRRLRSALRLIELGWAASLMVSGGHVGPGYNWARWQYEAAVDLGRREFGLEMRDRIFVEPCSAKSLTHLRNGLRMMAAMGLRHGLLLVDSQMSMQANVFYSQLDERVPRELGCRLGRVSYLHGHGPRPRLGSDATGCHPFVSWGSTPFGYLLSTRTPAVFWVSPFTRVGDRVHSALECAGGDKEITEVEPDTQDAWHSECLPTDDGFACDAERALYP